MLRWLKKKPNSTLTIAWCPGHRDIPGNDQVDQLAKQATSLPDYQNQQPSISTGAPQKQLDHPVAAGQQPTSPPTPTPLPGTSRQWTPPTIQNRAQLHR